MATISFLYRSEKPKQKLELRLLFSHDKINYVFGTNTKIEVSKEQWNKYHKKNPQKTSDVNILNTKSEILKIESYILTEFEKQSPTEIDKNWLINIVDSYYNPKKVEAIPTDLISFFDYYLNYRKNQLNAPSIMKYKTIQMKLKEFQAYRKQTILIKNVNEAFMNEFVDYYKSKNYAHNTTQREFSFIKTICRKARFLGLEVSHQLEGSTIKPKKVESIYLTTEELNNIEKTKQDSLELENAKDWLIISAYSGQRISDFMRFSIDMIRTENDQMYIEFKQKKTGKAMTVPLHTKIIDILNKRDFNFPKKILDQEYNSLIKIVCEKAKINEIVFGGKQKDNRKVYDNYKKHELVTSHIGRRSFATNNYGIIPTSYLIYITGHKTEVMFLNYIGKNNKDLAIEVAIYFK